MLKEQAKVKHQDKLPLFSVPMLEHALFNVDPERFRFNSGPVAA